MLSFALLLPLLSAQPAFDFNNDIDGSTASPAWSQVTGYTSGRYGSPARFMEHFLKWAKTQSPNEAHCNRGTNSHQRTSCLVYIAHVCDFPAYNGERASLTATCRSKVDAYFPPTMSQALRKNPNWNHLQLRRDLIRSLPQPVTVAAVFAMGMLIIRAQSQDADHVANLPHYVDNRNSYPAFRDWVETAPLRALSVSNLPIGYTRLVLNEARAHRSYLGKRAILPTSASGILNQIRDSAGACGPHVLNDLQADVLVTCHQLLDGYCNLKGKQSWDCRNEISFIFGRSVYNTVESQCSRWKFNQNNCNWHVDNAPLNQDQRNFARYLRDEYLPYWT